MQGFGGPLIREARLRARLTQAELAERTGRERSVIARWEQGAVSPSIDNLLAVVHACGFDLPLVLVPRDTSRDERLEQGRQLSPERRVDRLIDRVGGDVEPVGADPAARFDPRGLLAALDRHRVAYIVVGAFARVVQGADEVTRGIDIVTSTRAENLRRLDAALTELGARRPDGGEPTLADTGELEPVVELTTDRGELKIVPEPLGTGGYEDLRRAATREHIGQGLRPAIASLGDLSRMLASLGREDDMPKLLDLRRLAELEISHGIEI